MSVRKASGRSKSRPSKSIASKTRSVTKLAKIKFSSGQGSKEDVNYRSTPIFVQFPLVGEVAYTCEGCRYWTGSNSCSKVKGVIATKGSCSIWAFGKPVIMKDLSTSERKKLGI